MGLTAGTHGEDQGGTAPITVTTSWLLSHHPQRGGSVPCFPAGFVTSGTDGGGCWSWLWGSASPQSLAAAPL